jgi:hypothetical protein
MAPTFPNPTPPIPPATFRPCSAEPRDDRPQVPARRPERDLPPEAELQRWLDLSG